MTRQRESLIVRIHLAECASLALLFACLATSAGAQPTPGSAGVVRGVFGGTDRPGPARTTQQFAIWVDLGGGYDQNEDVSSSVDTADLRGAATTMLGGARWWMGRTQRSLEATARVFRNDQRAGDTTATGGEVNINGNAQLGRRAGISVGLRGANDSATLFGATGAQAALTPAVDPALNVPDVNPQQGIVRDRWFSMGGNGSVYRNWTARHRTTVMYSQVRRRPTEQEGLDSDQRLASLRQDWNVRMNTALLAVYRLEQVSQALPEVPNPDPVRTQAIEGGFRWDRRFSPIRAFTFSAQAGATQVLATPLAGSEADGAVEPTGAANISYALSRRWVVAVGATRTVTVLQGASQLPFTSNVASASATGVFGRHVTLSVGGSRSTGGALGSGPGSFEATGATGAIRYAFRYGGLFAGYTAYRHRVLDTPTLPGAIAPRFNQSSLRAGVTLWLPLFGAF